MRTREHPIQLQYISYIYHQSQSIIVSWLPSPSVQSPEEADSSNNDDDNEKDNDNSHNKAHHCIAG